MQVVNKQANFIERICNQGRNHSLMLLADEDTNKVELLKVSLNAQYSRFLEINYALNTSRISCLKENKPEYISIDKILEVDFPELTKLKSKIGLYITFL